MQKILLGSFLKLRSYDKNPGFTFFIAIRNVSPVVWVFKQKYSSVNQVFMLSFKQQCSIGIRWIIQSALKSGRSLINSLSIEIFIASNKKGLSYSKKLGVSCFFQKKS